MHKPLPTAVNGRASGGRFGAGNHFGQGNPRNRKAQELRSALLEAVTADDVAKALETIREVMDSPRGNERLAAAEALLDRVLGKPVAVDLLERIEGLEDALTRLATPPAL